MQLRPWEGTPKVYSLAFRTGCCQGVVSPINSDRRGARHPPLVGCTRKAAIYAEAAGLLAPGGVVVNMDLLAARPARLPAEFLDALGMEEDDPSGQPAPVTPQLAMLRVAGLTDIDCFWWKLRELAILEGHKPAVGGV